MERKERKSDITNVVRCLLVSIALHEEIYNSEIYNSINENKLSVLRFYLGKKGKDNENERYTLFGGKINPKEPPSQAYLREFSEEIGVRSLGIPNPTIFGPWEYSSELSGERRVVVTYQPIVPLDQKKIIGDREIEEVVILDLDKFEKLIEEGILGNIPIEGHLSKNPKEAIKISEEDRKIRNEALDKILSWMKHLEDYLVRRIKDYFDGTKNINYEDFLIFYQQLLTEFKRKGFQVGTKPKRPKEERNFEEIKLSERERKQRRDLLNVLDSGFLGKDILYFLPDLAVYGINWPALEQTTEETQIFVGFLKDTFNEFLEIHPEFTTTFQQLNNPSIPLEEKHNFFSSLNDFFTNKLKRIFSLRDDEINLVNFFVNRFFSDLSNEMKVADSRLTQGLYQDFTLVNEVANSHLGRLLSLFLGYDIKNNTEYGIQKIRFEAGRQLLLYFKAMVGIKHFNEMVTNSNNGRIRLALETFFGSIGREENIPLPKGSLSIIYRKIYRNQPLEIESFRSNEINEIIVDYKPPKSFTSFLRKSFEEEISKIKDVFSCSIVLTGENSPEAIKLRINAVDSLIQNFINFLNNQYSGLEITVS